MAAFWLPKVEDPVSTTYHGYQSLQTRLLEQGPHHAGAVTSILEGFDRTQVNSAEYIHRATEAMKLAYADRDTYFGDPKFNHIPTGVLLSKEYAAERRAQIGARASMEFSRKNQLARSASIRPRWT